MVRLILADAFETLSSEEVAPGLPDFDLAKLKAHGADAHLTVSKGNLLTARCSLWWKQTPSLTGQSLGFIGHYAALDFPDAHTLLSEAFQVLKQHDCHQVVGPMDGNTWRHYRFVSEPGLEEPFFLEPQNPPAWPEHFLAAGFEPLATYYSSVNRNLQQSDPRAMRARQRLEANGVSIRTLRQADLMDELKRIYQVSAVSFQFNFLYTPIAEPQFLAQYQSIAPLLDPRFVFIAEHQGQPVGFAFAIPDHAQALRGQTVDTLVLKTVAVLPGRTYAGLGAVLVNLVQEEAYHSGFRRVIHALMHESNQSKNLSAHTAEIFRRYTLYARFLRS
jgi:predicted N-acetyltransferase YhbS